MFYKCDCCGKIIDSERLHLGNTIPFECPYCEQHNYLDPFSDISFPAVRTATTDEIVEYEEQLHRLSTEQGERATFLENLVTEYKPKIRQAFNDRKAYDFEKFIYKEAEQLSINYLDMTLKNWKVVLNALTRAYYLSSIESKFKYTPKKYRANCSKEELDRIADIFELDGKEKLDLYKRTGINCSK